MTSRVFFHYLLAFTVLFASSFAVFHGSEHISIENTDSAIASLTKDHFDSFHAEHSHHDATVHDPAETTHSVESLCEACLVLSNLFACNSGHTDFGFLPNSNKHQCFNLVHVEKQAFQTYLSRAPPSNA
jgi:hypothetical protein